MQEISRDLYDDASDIEYDFRADEGLSEDVIRKISADKSEPEWMLDLRLKAFEQFKKLKTPTWGPDLSDLDLEKISYYISPTHAQNQKSWDDVPDEIKETFEKLGIPEAERKALAGAGAQMESKMAYHNLKEKWEQKGVIFLDMDEALKQHEDLVKDYFSKCVPTNDHKFAALHYAVWSGGTFLYIPKGVYVDQPLQAYFRMNSERAGQFEHTLIIVEDGAHAHYVEGCFAAGAQIQTLNGRKFIEHIEEGDFVLTHKGKYERVYKTQKRKYTGKLYEIAYWGGSTQPIKITDKHPLLFVKRQYKNDKNKDWTLRWGTPTDMKQKDYLVKPINRIVMPEEIHTDYIPTYNRRKKCFTYKKVSFPASKEFFRLAGYYLAEGSISSGSYLNFSFNKNERTYINDVKKCLKKVFGIKKIYETHHKKNNGTNVVVASVDLCRIFKQFGQGAKNKQIPPWMSIAEPEKQKELVIGLFRGDGNIYAKTVSNGVWKEVVRYSTISEELGLSLQEILLRIGIPAFFNERDRSKEKRNTMYTVGISGLHLIKLGKVLGFKTQELMRGKKRASMFHIDENYAYFPIRKMTNKKVTKLDVYNFGVEKDESYVAQGIVSHNCSAPKFNSNSIHAGCVEIFVKKDAQFRYSSVENWSINTYNLNTKRAIVQKGGTQEWVGGNLGCLTGDSKIATNPKGSVNIADISPGDKVISWNKRTNKLEKSTVLRTFESGHKEVFDVDVAGRTIKATKNHPFLTLEHRKNHPSHKKGFFHHVWKPLEKLNPGDIIAIAKQLPDIGEPQQLPEFNYDKIVKSKNQYPKEFQMNVKHLFNEVTWPKETTEDFMWFCGVILGDGNVWFDKKGGGAKINIAIPESSDLREPVIKVAKKLFNYEITYKRDRYVIINSVPIATLLHELGFSKLAHEKTIPKWVFKTPKKQIMAFLAGYFDADGHIGKNGLYFTSTSKELLQGVKDLALTCGLGFSRVFSHGKARKVIIQGVKCNAKNSFRVLVNGEKVKLLPTKSHKYEEEIRKIKTKRNYSTRSGLNFQSKVNEDIGFAKIDRIESRGVKPTFDIEVEKHHNFVSDGVIVHNSGTTMLYPCSMLIGERARAEHLAIAFASKGQNQDTGAKVFHLAPKTTSRIVSKSIAIQGGITSYRGLLRINKGAKGAKSNVECDALMIDNQSQSNTYPYVDINEQDVDVGHEATVGRISDEQIFYLTSRGIPEEEAMKMLVTGFMEPITKELPIEYAVEMNKLIELEMEGSIG